MAPRPGAATKAPGITAETVKAGDSVGDVAVDSEGVLLGEAFVDFAVDSFRDVNDMN